MRFTKPPLSYEDQLDRLQERGLVVADRREALHYLSQLNYYRLGAYWLPFESDHSTHALRSGTTFEQVLNLYIFDRELRLLTLDALERVEVSVRAGWAYHMAHTHGSHCHLRRALFKDRWNYSWQRQQLEQSVSHSQEAFIRHLRQEYNEPLPPVWALVEVMTFGQISQWFGNTRYRSDRDAVARRYGIDERVLVSAMHHLTTVRNTCAHHGRLWNREFTVIPKVPNRGPRALLQSLRNDGDRRLYNTLVLLLFLMNTVNPGHHWRSRLTALLASHDINTEAMGFPSDWRIRPLWN
jgi:abortive infection bacteriophage resistance protein